MPRNVEVVSQRTTAITLTWDAPLDLGGRDDVRYDVCYEDDDEFYPTELCIITTANTLTISGWYVVQSM
jgi:hypothetical protein